jgi:hypothetical protein
MVVLMLACLIIFCCTEMWIGLDLHSASVGALLKGMWMTAKRRAPLRRLYSLRVCLRVSKRGSKRVNSTMQKIGYFLALALASRQSGATVHRLIHNHRLYNRHSSLGKAWVVLREPEWSAKSALQRGSIQSRPVRAHSRKRSGVGIVRNQQVSRSEPERTEAGGV